MGLNGIGDVLQTPCDNFLHVSCTYPYPTAWLIHHKLMQAMVEREADYVLCGTVQIDDAYLGGELNDGTAGRGSTRPPSWICWWYLHADIPPPPLGGHDRDHARGGCRGLTINGTKSHAKGSSGLEARHNGRAWRVRS